MNIPPKTQKERNIKKEKSFGKMVRSKYTIFLWLLKINSIWTGWNNWWLLRYLLAVFGKVNQVGTCRENLYYALIKMEHILARLRVGLKCHPPLTTMPLLPIFLENCMEMKKIGLKEGARVNLPLLLVYYQHLFLDLGDKFNSSPNGDFRFWNFVHGNQKLKEQKWQYSLNLDLNTTCCNIEIVS